MILPLLTAFALTTASISTSEDWLVQDFRARQIAREQAKPLFEQTVLQWKNCLIPKAKSLSRSRESADVIARAAIAECSQWEEPIRVGLPGQVALKNSSMPFKDAMRFAEMDVDKHFLSLKNMMHEQLISQIVSLRAARR